MNEKDLKDADTVFSVCKDMGNLADAKKIAVLLYVPDMTFSRAGISHAIEMLERHYKDNQDEV